MTYPKSWNRQTPKGYESNIALLQYGEPLIKNISKKACCETCSCNTESTENE